MRKSKFTTEEVNQIYSIAEEFELTYHIFLDVEGRDSVKFENEKEDLFWIHKDISYGFEGIITKKISITHKDLKDTIIYCLKSLKIIDEDWSFENELEEDEYEENENLGINDIQDLVL